MKYSVNDKVVFRANGQNQIGVITNVKTADKKTYYCLRGEDGRGFVLVPVDKARNKWSDSYCVIDSKLTESWNNALEKEEVTPTKLMAKDGYGHTRGNYAEGIKLYFDGEHNGQMGQLEKRNDFVFPTQGPRSF